MFPRTAAMAPLVRKTLPRSEGTVEVAPPVSGPLATPIASVNSKVTRKIPTVVQLLLVVVISFSTSYVLFQSLGPLTDFELAGVSKHANGVEDYALFPVLKVLELVVGWLVGFDDYDMASLALQTRLPYYFLLTTFYSISLRTCSLALVYEVLSAALPFTLLRNRIPQHSSTAPRAAVANYSIIQNLTLNALVTLFAATVYGVIMYISYNSWLLPYLITNFDGVRTFDVAHNSQLPVLVLTFFPLGWTAKILLFAPATGAQPSLGEIKQETFDPAVAGLVDHVKFNVWGWSKGTKVALKRTIVLAVTVFLATFVKTWKTLEGSELMGSAGWAALWALASLLNGALLRWVGDV